MTGIYRIANLVTGKSYIGSSEDIQHRWLEHKSLLRRGKHPNIKLQRSWKKHGETQFIFEVVEECENVIEREQFYIDTEEPWYNIRKFAATNKGIKIEVSQKRIDANRRNNELRGKLTAQKCKIVKGSTEQVFDSLTDAAKVIGAPKTLVMRAANRENGTCRGYSIFKIAQ